MNLIAVIMINTLYCLFLKHFVGYCDFCILFKHDITIQQISEVRPYNERMRLVLA